MYHRPLPEEEPSVHSEVLRVLGGTGGYWEVLGGTGWYWGVLGALEVLGGTGRYWGVLGGTGRYWEVLGGTGGTGGYWFPHLTLVEPSPFKHTLCLITFSWLTSFFSQIRPKSISYLLYWTRWCSGQRVDHICPEHRDHGSNPPPDHCCMSPAQLYPGLTL